MSSLFSKLKLNKLKLNKLNSLPAWAIYTSIINVASCSTYVMLTRRDRIHAEEYASLTLELAQDTAEYAKRAVYAAQMAELALALAGKPDGEWSDDE